MSGTTEPDLRRPLLLLGLLAAALPVGLILYRAVGTNLYSPRNLIPSLPAIMLLVGTLFARLRGAAGLVCAAVFAAGFGVGAWKALGDDGRRPPWNLAARWIDRHTGPERHRGPARHGRLYGLRQPLFYSMVIFFDRPHPWVVPIIVGSAWDDAAKSRRVVVARSVLPGERPAVESPPRRRSMATGAQRRWHGLNDVAVSIWVRRGPVADRRAALCPDAQIRDHRSRRPAAAAVRHIVPTR